MLPHFQGPGTWEDIGTSTFFGGESDREYVTGIDWEDVVQLFLVRLEKLPQLFRPFVFSVFLDDLGKS